MSVVSKINLSRMTETHCYTLWRDVFKHEAGIFIADDISISVGEHGAIQIHPVHDRKETPEVLASNDRISKLAEHNMAEIQRAMEEGGKWELRLQHSRLGKTPQDFVAYYTDVIDVFTAWCTEHGIQIQQVSKSVRQ